MSPLTSVPDEKEEEDGDDLSEEADEAEDSLPDQFWQMSLYLPASM